FLFSFSDLETCSAPLKEAGFYSGPATLSTGFFPAAPTSFSLPVGVDRVVGRRGFYGTGRGESTPFFTVP
ncbi:hypothetical protein, partial [Caenispirillum bisanense]|uniref:hypothetical protein n=1 Tax=Caenispirillum bisanense TaxID=414052 RepID=UPI001C3E9ED8